MDACPEDNQLSRFALGGLAEAEAARVEGHLDVCEACVQAVASATGDEPAATSGPVPGTCIGPYVVEGLLGQGGMGAVYLARDGALGRKVALKLVGGVADSVARSRLEREAQAMARLTHPNVVTVFALVEWEHQGCIAMEWVEGATLRQWRKAAARSPAEVLRVLLEAGQGLAAAHAAGLVHRDFKPANVLLGPDGRARVSDFGLSRPVPGGAVTQDAAGEGDEPLTRSGSVLGTLPYMAPEQLDGQVADARSDQFSFCVTLVECFTGRRPWSGRTALALREAIGKPPTLTGVPAALVTAVKRGLSLEPEARFPGMPELLSALRAVEAPPPARRAWVAVAAVTALACAVAVAWWVPHAAPAPATTASPIEFEVKVGELRVLRAPGVTRAAVGDSAIAQVELVGDEQLLVRGRTPGVTPLMTWTPQGKSEYPVRVVSPEP